jgi:hypothetical protein
MWGRARFHRHTFLASVAFKMASDADSTAAWCAVKFRVLEDDPGHGAPSSQFSWTVLDNILII